MCPPRVCVHACVCMHVHTRMHMCKSGWSFFCSFCLEKSSCLKHFKFAVPFPGSFCWSLLVFSSYVYIPWCFLLPASVVWPEHPTQQGQAYRALPSAVPRSWSPYQSKFSLLLCPITSDVCFIGSLFSLLSRTGKASLTPSFWKQVLSV